MFKDRPWWGWEIYDLGNDLMHQLTIGLISAAVMGITTIAYRQPALYEREFSAKIIWVSGGMLISAIIHDVGVTSANDAFMTLLADVTPEEIEVAVKTAKATDGWWMIAGCTFIYGGFLSWLAEKMGPIVDSQENSISE